jgi:hypothetical protein
MSTHVPRPVTRPAHLVHPDYLELLKTMPRAADGTVKDLKYVPHGQQEAYTEAWRQWCREHPDRTMWPAWLHEFIAAKKRKQTRDAP